MKVKVCGMRDPGNIAEVAALEPDYMGFILFDRSPRYASATPGGALRHLPESICKVGVFVDATCDAVYEAVARWRFDAVQLHGVETPELCAAVRKLCPVIKAIWVASERAAPVAPVVGLYADSVDYLLFDTHTPNYGGSGRQFDWDVLDDYDGAKPFFLGGGVGPKDAERINAVKISSLHAVDLNSRFETAPGIKDAAALAKFIKSVRYEQD
ncbi:MAG: phosphoribosylanthranilate isomerase [Rikenellaceae bacterium]|jgi:phosphoribosylanthranilate isomerase|nr:phosphoribosylanthranilate isomerase [Rikenellaceae bacterium]